MKIVFWAKPQRTSCFFNEKGVLGIIFSPLPNNFGWYTILFFQALVPQKVSFKRIYAQKDYFFLKIPLHEKYCMNQKKGCMDFSHHSDLAK